MTKKQKKMLLRILIAAALFVAAVIITRKLELPWFIDLAVFLPPYAFVGFDVVFKAFRNIFRGNFFDENFLMTVATVGAFAVSEYSEAVAVMLFYQVGELFQSIAVGKSRRSVAALMQIRPDIATVIRDGKEDTVSPEELLVGETVVVRPGEKIPTDGEVVCGSSSVNTSALTGESVPRDVAEGDRVFGGSVNEAAVLYVKVTAPFENSSVARILELTETAAAGKSRTENFITRFAKIYTPAIVSCAALLFLIPTLIFGYSSEWLHRALVFLVVSCPCALVISVPMSFFGGIGGASRRGILIKGANRLEALSKVKTVVFDKTGTLTTGRFGVSEVVAKGMTEAELIGYAVSVEAFSNHPIARAVCAYGSVAEKRSVMNVREHSGLGTEAEVDGKRVNVGNLRYMQSLGIQDVARPEGKTAVHIAVGGEYRGYIVISDEPKETSAEAVKRILDRGADRNVMLTGDSLAAAKDVAEKVGIKEFYAELMPEDKTSVLEKLLSEKPKRATVAYVGDGINDAPVLSLADVGIAMGALGSDAAIEAADVVIMNDDLLKVAEAIDVSRKTVAIVKQNIVFALCIKFAVLILGAFSIVGMWAAVFADVGVAVLAILNAMRTMIKK